MVVSRIINSSTKVFAQFSPLVTALINESVERNEIAVWASEITYVIRSIIKFGGSRPRY